MTSLVVDELITELSQDVNILQKMSVGSIKWHFYVHNMPAGSFFFEIRRGGDLYATFNFNSSLLRSSFGGTSNYFRVFYPFSNQAPIYLYPGQYTFKITCTGYTYSASSFLGVCKDWDQYFGQELGSNPEFTEHPYSFRIIERRLREL